MTVEKIPEVTDVQWASINQKNRKIVEEFLKESIQLSDQTLSQYTSALRIYFCYIKDNCEDKDFDKIKSKDFLLYQNYLTRRGLSSSAVRLKRAAVSSLNSYIETYYEELNFRSYITKKISAPTSAFVNEKNPPTLEEYSLMCKELEKLEMWQHLAYLKFTFSTGCRRAESIQLLKEVINAEKQEKEIKVKDENGNEWMEIRGNDDCPYVFVSKHNHVVKQLNPATLNLWGTTIFTKLLGRRFHPHILRESRATSLVVEQGRDIKVVQKLLGHESSQTSELYVIRDDEDMSDEAFT